MNKIIWWNDLEKNALKKFKQNVYNSSSWKMCRNHILNADPFCVECTKNGRTTEAVDVDHIIGLGEVYRSGRWSLMFDINNLQGLCKQCHGTKTRKK